VRIERASESEVRARVIGSEYYTVELSIKGDDFFVSCTCPYFYQDYCKHIWATMLAAESRGFLDGGGQLPSRLRMADEDSPDYEDDYYDEEDDEEEEVEEQRTNPIAAARTQSPGQSAWKKYFSEVDRGMRPVSHFATEFWSPARQLFYIVDRQSTLQGGSLIIDMAFRERKLNGEWSKLRQKGLPSIHISTLPDPDRSILSLMTGAKMEYSGYQPIYNTVLTRYRLAHPVEQSLMPRICATGRCLLRLAPGDTEMTPLEWDDGPAWELWLEARRSRANNCYVITGSLRRNDDRLEMTSPSLLVSGGLAFIEDRVARLEDFGAFAWISLLRARGSLYVPADQRDQLLAELLALPALPRLDLARELQFKEKVALPTPLLKVYKPKSGWSRDLQAALSFDYDGEAVAADDKRRGIYRAGGRRFLLRDWPAEQRAREQLKHLGFKQSYSHYSSRSELEFSPNNLPRAVRVLVGEGWKVEAEGKLYRQPGEFRLAVSSGIDWFDLDGSFNFEGLQASLPQLLAALRRGDAAVELGDGTFGLLPEEWLKRYGALAGLGKAEGEQLRFTRTQVGLLDALLAQMPEATFDAAFRHARDELMRFKGIKPTNPPAGFTGKLRGYQKKDSDGSTSSINSGWAVASQTTWGRARQWPRLRCSNRAASYEREQANPRVDREPAERSGGAQRMMSLIAGSAPRFLWSRNRWSSTGSRSQRGSPRTCRCSITRAWRDSSRASTLKITTSSSQLTARCDATRSSSKTSTSTT
jgi:hypothetical protein